MVKKSDNLETMALATLDITQVPDKYDDNVYKKLSQATTYLPRIQLFSNKSDAVTNVLIEGNHYGLVVNKKITDLGREVKVLIIARRPKAMDLSNKEAIVNSYKPDSDIFQSIIERSDVKDSGCMYGIEFLIWLPIQKEYCTLFLGSKSGRGESSLFSEQLGKAAMLKSRTASNKKFVWQMATCSPCSESIDLPTEQEEFNKTVQMFTNPPDAELSKADVDSQER
jgi:hypothetical protein